MELLNYETEIYFVLIGQNVNFEDIRISEPYSVMIWILT